MTTRSDDPWSGFPADFEERCALLSDRLVSGEEMSIEQLAHHLGLPTGLVTVCMNFLTGLVIRDAMRPDRTLN